jgi:hypothetical protein
MGRRRGLIHRPRRRRNGGNRRDQPIAHLGQGFDVSRLPGLVAQQRTQFCDGARKHLVIDHPPQPHVANQLVASHDLARRGSQPQQDIHQQRPDAHGLPVPVQLVRRGIGDECTDFQRQISRRAFGRIGHGWSLYLRGGAGSAASN